MLSLFREHRSIQTSVTKTDIHFKSRRAILKNKSNNSLQKTYNLKTQKLSAPLESQHIRVPKPTHSPAVLSARLLHWPIPLVCLTILIKFKLWCCWHIRQCVVQRVNAGTRRVNVTDEAIAPRINALQDIRDNNNMVINFLLVQTEISICNACV